ncbi:hypothetical protein CASFOL_031386 [Castilleja foliolosa]|uniref:Uncharacterized protein n=1 Tax=Castilleja foliolosa TaxID=1961234 RepID=A0ABD3C4K4_9LAMI
MAEVRTRRRSATGTEVIVSTVVSGEIWSGLELRRGSVVEGNLRLWWYLSRDRS